MSQVVFDCQYTEARNRGTTAIRVILAIPHLILLGLWQQVVRFTAVIQWFIVVFTGKRNKQLWDFAYAEEGYNSRVSSYLGLLHDVWPPFLTEQGTVPTRYSLEYTGKHPRGQWDFLLKYQRFSLQAYAYLFLLTDTYPKY